MCHELTIPKKPQQNGVTELLNRTLVVETVHSMLSDSKLPKIFWAKALSTAAFLCSQSVSDRDTFGRLFCVV